MAKTDKYKYLLKNTGLATIGGLGSKILVYLLVRFYTSVLTTAEYGLASNVSETATLLLPIISLGIADAVFRFAMDKEYNQNEVFSAGFMTLGMGCLSFLFVVPVLLWVDLLDGYEWVVVSYILCSSVHGICNEFVRAHGKYGLCAVQGILNTLIMIGSNVLFLLVFKMGVTGYVLSTVVADLLSTIFLIIAAKLYRSFAFGSVRTSTVKSMLKYSLPMIPSTICWWVTNVSDRYMITWFIDESVTGLYAAANKIPSLMMVLAGIFINSWKNSAVMENESSDRSEFFSNVFDAFSSVLVMVSSAIIAFTQVITFIMLDKSYHSGWIYIPVLTFSMIFFNYDSFFGSIYVAKKKSNLSFYTSVAGAVTNVGLNLWLIRTPLGAMGAAIATVASYFIVFILRLISARRILPFDMKPVKLTANFGVLIIQLVSIMTQHRFWIPVQIICLGAIVAINGVKLLKFASRLLKKDHSVEKEQ